MQYTNHYQSPLGGITMAADGERLTGLWFDGQKYFADTLSKEHAEVDLPVFRRAKQWLDRYFGGEEPDFQVPLLLDGSPFRTEVWEILRNIPWGQVMTYGEIANRVAERRGIETMSAQAVGGAVAHNPISIIVPCHRVVGSGGSLTGYAGGVEKKRALLSLEGADMTGLFVPRRGTAL